MKEKWNNTFNVWVEKGKKIEQYLDVTEHGTVCRKDLKETAEKNNIEGKNKDYLDIKKKRPKFNRKAIHMQRVMEMQKLLQQSEKGKLTPEEKNRFNKLKLLERGFYKPEYYKFKGVK